MHGFDVRKTAFDLSVLVCLYDPLFDTWAEYQYFQFDDIFSFIDLNSGD